MAIQIIDYGTPEYEQMVQLRHLILRKPLGLSFTEEELDCDKDDILIGCSENNKLIGCCALRKMNNNTLRLRQMAVNAGLQGKGIGRAILVFAENIGRDFGYTNMIMHVRKPAIGFYEKSGYNIYGDEFIEVTLPHLAMEKSLKKKYL